MSVCFEETSLLNSIFRYSSLFVAWLTITHDTFHYNNFSLYSNIKGNIKVYKYTSSICTMTSTL